MEEQDCTLELEAEREHTAFLEELLRTLYGEGWNHITICDAERWHKQHFKFPANTDNQETK